MKKGFIILQGKKIEYTYNEKEKSVGYPQLTIGFSGLKENGFSNEQMEIMRIIKEENAFDKIKKLF